MNYQTLVKKLRPINWFDKLRACIFKSGCTFSGDYCEVYSDWLDNKLANMDINTLKVDTHSLTFKTTSSEHVKLWVANYPYNYGNDESYNSPYERRNKYPSWKVVLKLREIHLSQKDKILENYKKSLAGEIK